MEKMDHLVYSREVIEFTAVANEYCNLLERASETNGLKLLKIEQKILPLLYYKAMMIPRFDSVLEEPLEKFVTEEEWKKIEQSLLSMLGEANDFLEVFDDRLKESDGPVVSSIAENLADIYQDMKDYLIHYNIGTVEIMNDALWECLESSKLFWGQKLVNTLRAIHSVLQSPEKIVPKSSDITKNADKEIDTSGWIISKRQQEIRDSENE